MATRMSQNPGKQRLRSLIRDEKRRHSQQELNRWSEEIICKVEALPVFVRARTVLAYYSLPDEVETHEALERWRQVKKVLIPSVGFAGEERPGSPKYEMSARERDGDALLLHQYTGIDCLQDGAFGIKESVGTLVPSYEYDTVDLVIVPGMAFDRKGNRLGRGRGFYDRLLPLLERAKRVGVAFPFQIVSYCPHELTDSAMDIVVSADTDL